MKSISFLVILLTILLVCMAADPPSLSNPTKENTSPDPIVDGEHALETVDNKETEKVNKKKPYKKKTKDWQEMDINAVEKELEDGDDPELLEHEFEVQRRLNDKAMRNRNMGINFNDPKSVAKLLKDPTAAIGASKGPGGAMLFIELNEKQPNGKDWTKLDEDTLSAKLSALMRTGLIHCQLFNIGNGDGHRLLGQVEKGYQTSDALKFLLKQPEIKEVTLDNKKYTPAQFKDDDDEDL